jgi:hypothetical protein
MPWLRWYVETTRDPKLRRRPGDEQWCWPAILAIASSSPERGVLLMVDGTPATIDDIADEAGKPAKVARSAVAYFEKDGVEMLGRRDDGAWFVTAWVRRQPRSDNVTARTRAFRERSAEQLGNVPENHSGNGDGERSLERSPFCSSSKSKKVDDFEADFEVFWATAEKRPKDNKQDALRAYAATRRKGASCEDLLTGLAGYMADPSRSGPTYTMRMSRFLGPSGHWREYLDVPSRPAPAMNADVERINQLRVAQEELMAREMAGA